MSIRPSTVRSKGSFGSLWSRIASNPFTRSSSSLDSPAATQSRSFPATPSRRDSVFCDSLTDEPDSVHDRLSQIEQLLTVHGEDVNATGWHGETLLHTAATYGDLELVVLLLRFNAVDKQDRSGRLALHMAAQRGDMLMTQLLMRPTSNIKVKDHRGHTPLHLSLLHGHEEVATLLFHYDTHFNLDRENEPGRLGGVRAPPRSAPACITPRRIGTI
ncbi:MAG: hypothetical protein M1825_003445 [Sarcosagium campestre]|nr:MAG: hypothetical protein M1825_003445 [Sarcosagium campestre]